MLVSSADIRYNASERSKTPVEDLISRIKSEAKSSAIGIQCNLRELSAPQQIIQASLDAFGPNIDILINNAAAISDKFCQDITPSHFDEVMHLNVRAPLLMLQAVLPHLRRPGRIINIASAAARAGYPGTGTYAASKAALEGYTRNWAVELGHDGTTVNCVNPGPVQSEMLEQVAAETVDMQKKLTPVENRLGTPDEIAEIVAFLAEPRSSWVTGQCIAASGGYQTY